MSNAAAHDSLVIVKAYHDRLIAKTLTTTEQLDCIKHGSQHLAQAREADPHATLTVQEKSGSVTYTQEFFSAFFLFSQSVYEQMFDDKPGILKALETLKRATAYMPKAPWLHRSIAEALLKLNRRDEAIVAAKFAVALDPSSMDGRILLDKIQATPTLGVAEHDPTAEQKTRALAIMLACPIGFVLLVFLNNATGGINALSPLLQASIMFGLVGLFIYGFKSWRSVERTRYLQKKFQKDFYS